VDPKAGLDDVEKILDPSGIPTLKPWPSSPYPVTLPIVPCRLSVYVYILCVCLCVIQFPQVSGETESISRISLSILK
jgi:hypothetical protein